MKAIFFIRTMSKIVIGTFAIFYMQSCKYNCPAFRDENLCWIPYNKGDFLHYTDGENDIIFEIIDYYKTEPSSSMGVWMDVWCEEEGYYLTNQESNYFIHEFYSLCCRHDKNEMEVKITDKDIFSFTVSPLSFYNVKQTIRTDLMEITFYPDTTIGNHQCTKTFLISKTKMNDSERISWIIKAKDKGIVQFFDKKSGKKWTLL